MAIKLNLLPPEYAVSTGLSRILNVTRMLGVIALAAFLIFGVGIGAFFIISSIQLSGLNSSNNSLKSQILAQSQTESQVVLLKDRVKKIKLALNQPSSIKNLTNINPYLSVLGASSSVGELDVDATKMTATVNFKSNTDLSNFIQSITSSTAFKNVTETSFGFNPLSGYLIGISFESK